MEEYCVAFKEKRSINAEAQFEMDTFKNTFPDIYDQIRICDLGPFTGKAMATHAQGTHRYITMLTVSMGVRARAQRAQAHESHLVKLAMEIPSMILLAINKAMQPAKDKFKSLGSSDEVLERDVISLRKEVAALGEPQSTSTLNPSEPTAVPV
ncbi:hypothetical protein HAX54_034816 [Datura stramonium]|uniref:Uncharacterized protein n=1 Tax=Datura stramonium TaxID=4076 RepID=A0ABS8VIB0_DATST|nr:hypothetical protein [Datura stramonium]